MADTEATQGGRRTSHTGWLADEPHRVADGRGHAAQGTSAPFLRHARGAWGCPGAQAGPCGQPHWGDRRTGTSDIRTSRGGDRRSWVQVGGAVGCHGSLRGRVGAPAGPCRVAQCPRRAPLGRRASDARTSRGEGRISRGHLGGVAGHLGGFCGRVRVVLMLRGGLLGLPRHGWMATREEWLGGRPGLCGGWIMRGVRPRRRVRRGRRVCAGPGRGRERPRPRARSRRRRRRRAGRQGRGSGEAVEGAGREVAGGQTGGRLGDGGAVTTR